MEKHAILINGDAHSGLSEEHAKNMRVLGDFLGRNGYRVSKLEGEKITREKLSRVVEGMRGKMDGDDELFLYVTGHGSMEEGLECAVVDDGTPVPLQWLDEQTRSLEYKERVVWLDGCYSGGSLRYFSQDPRTLFVSAGSKDETVGCFLFTPPAFENGKDINNDGVITFAERFIAGAENIRAKGGTFSPTYFSGRDYEDNGVGDGKTKPRFSADVASVSTAEELKEKLNALQHGEYAVVDFSASWCGPCRDYKPYFDKMAKEDGGRYLWIRAEGEGEPWGEWQIAHYPTVKIFHEGNSVGYEVSRRENPLGEIPSALEDPAAQKKRFLENILSQMEYGLVLETAAAVKNLAKWVENGKVLNEDLIKIFNERPGTRVGIIQTLEQVGYSRGEHSWQEDWQWEIRLTHAVLKDSDEWVRKAVVEALPHPQWDAATRFLYPWVETNKKILKHLLFKDSSIHVRGAAARKLMSYDFTPEEAKGLIGKIGEGIRSGYFGPIEEMDLLVKLYVDWSLNFPDGKVPIDDLRKVYPSLSKVYDFLFEFLDHPDWLVRREASQSIELYSVIFSTDRTLRRKFAAQLQKMVDSDPMEEVRYAAASALVSGLGDKYPPAVPVLVDEMKATGSRLYLWFKENWDNMDEKHRESFRESLREINFRHTMAIRNLGSMGETAKKAIPDLIEEILVYPRDSGNIVDILNAFFAIDPDGAPEHLKTIWLKTTTGEVVDVAVLTAVKKLGVRGIKLLEDFLKEDELKEKAIREATAHAKEYGKGPFESMIKSVQNDLIEIVKSSLRNMGTQK